MKRFIFVILITGFSSFSLADETKTTSKPTSLNDISQIISKDLSDIEGITIRVKNNQVVIEGRVLLPQDLNRIYAKANQFDGKVTSLVKVNPLAMKKIAEIIERDINNPHISVAVVDGNFILKGKVNSIKEKSRAEIIAKTYVPEYLYNEKNKRKRTKVINLISSV